MISGFLRLISKPLIEDFKIEPKYLNKRKNLMRTKTFSIIALALLALTFSACSFSFSTANISSFNFGKNESATPPATIFNVGEKIYAVAAVSNAMGKYKMKFNLTYDNVPGKSKGETIGTRDIDFDGSSSVTFNFSSPLPGDYKVEATLLDEEGKEIGKKSGTVTVKGSAPTAPAAETKTGNDDNSEETDDKTENE